MHCLEGKRHFLNDRCIFKIMEKKTAIYNMLFPSRNAVLFDLSMCLSFLRVIVCTYFVLAKGFQQILPL